MIAWLLYYLLLNFIQTAQTESNGTKQLELNSPPQETKSCSAEITLDRQMNDLVNMVQTSPAIELFGALTPMENPLLELVENQ